MIEVAELQVQIDTAISDLEKDYEKAVKVVKKLKDKMNELELKISDQISPKANGDSDKLNSAIKRLDTFNDSLILKSARAWEEYEKLEHDCKTYAFESTRLNDLRAQCQNMERLARDLLCYSLGFFRRKSID